MVINDKNIVRFLIYSFSLAVHRNEICYTCDADFFSGPILFTVIIIRLQEGAAGPCTATVGMSHLWWQQSFGLFVGVVLQYLIWHFYRATSAYYRRHGGATMVGGRLGLLGGDENGAARRAVRSMPRPRTRPGRLVTRHGRSVVNVAKRCRGVRWRTAGTTAASKATPHSAATEMAIVNGESIVSLQWRTQLRVHYAHANTYLQFKTGLFFSGVSIHTFIHP